MVTIEVHHAIGRLPASPLSDYVWETLPLGDGMDSFPSEDDPRIDMLVSRLMVRPDVIGVRVVQADDPARKVPGPPAGAPPVSPGAVLKTFGS